MMPTFYEDLPESSISQAEKECGKYANKSCNFDLVITGSVKFATRSTAIQKENYPEEGVKLFILHV